MAADACSDTSSEGPCVGSHGMKASRSVPSGQRGSTSPESTLMSMATTSPASSGTSASPMRVRQDLGRSAITMDESLVFEELQATKTSLRRISTASGRVGRVGPKRQNSASPRTRLSLRGASCSPTFAESLVFEEVSVSGSPMRVSRTRHDYTLSMDSLVFEEVGGHKSPQTPLPSAVHLRACPLPDTVDAGLNEGKQVEAVLHADGDDDAHPSPQRPVSKAAQNYRIPGERDDEAGDIVPVPSLSPAPVPASAEAASDNALQPPRRRASADAAHSFTYVSRRSNSNPQSTRSSVARASDGRWQHQLRGDAYKDVKRDGQAFLFKSNTQADKLRLKNGYHGCSFGAPPDAPLTSERLDRIEALNRAPKAFQQLRDVDQARRDADICQKCGRGTHPARDCPQAAREAGFRASGGAMFQRSVTGTFPSLPPIPNMKDRVTKYTPTHLGGVASRFREWEEQPQTARGFRRASQSGEPVQRSVRAATPPSRASQPPVSPSSRPAPLPSTRASRGRTRQRLSSAAKALSQPPPQTREAGESVGECHAISRREAAQVPRGRSTKGHSRSASQRRCVSPRSRAAARTGTEEPKPWVMRLSRPQSHPELPQRPTAAERTASRDRTGRSESRGPLCNGRREDKAAGERKGTAQAVITRLQDENRKLQEAIVQMKAKMKSLGNLGRQPVVGNTRAERRKERSASSDGLARNASVGAEFSHPSQRTLSSPAVPERHRPSVPVTPSTPAKYATPSPAAVRRSSLPKKSVGVAPTRSRTSAPSYEAWRQLKRHGSVPDDLSMSPQPDDTTGPQLPQDMFFERVESMQSTLSHSHGAMRVATSRSSSRASEHREQQPPANLEARIESLEILQKDVRAVLQHPQAEAREEQVGVESFGRSGAGGPGIPLTINQLHAQRKGDTRVQCVDDAGAWVRRSTHGGQTREGRAMLSVLKPRWHS
eukprot:TRINITY_DN1494_c0_g1_i1.p1 TRINITY_DN1494_c0_g1~~TRINITY_DN1494_c0_g1_i1.p1  ORF type:complete len:965 (+),score=96.21 TRINITY_DN1494_c0_g1_i1:66-2897(+)